MLVKKIKLKGFNNNQLAGNFYQNSNSTGIIFCHGLISNSQEFGNFPEKLSQFGYQVLTFDYSGHGKSQGIKHLITQESHRKDTQAVIDFLLKNNLEKITIIGHSLGAYPAILIASEEEKISAAVLVCPSRKSGDNLVFYKKVIVWLIGWFYYFFGWLIRKEIYLNLKGKKLNIRYLSYALKINNLKLASKINKPILIIAGAKDKDVSLEKIKSLYNKINSRDKKLLVLKKSGHNPFIGPDQKLLLNKINQFIQQSEKN